MPLHPIDSADDRPLGADPLAWAIGAHEDIAASTAPWTWSDLVTMEPALAVLERVARSTPEAERTWYAWSTSIKLPMMRLVGWESRRPELRTSQVYDVAYSHLLRAWGGE